MMKAVFITIFFVIPGLCSAAVIEVDIDTGAYNVNAVEGRIVLPGGARVSDIYTGDSKIVFWVDGPRFDIDTHTITFAGLTPGGFLGKGTLFTIVGELSSPNLLKAQGIIALQNDGKATEAPVKITFHSGSSTEDKFSPEAFSINLSQSEGLYEGSLFASFATTDKGLGIDHYEVAEKLIGSPTEDEWHLATSPYEVGDHTLLRNIFVKAVDKAGNARVVSQALPRRHFSFGILAILIGASCVFALRKRYSRYS